MDCYRHRILLAPPRGAAALARELAEAERAAGAPFGVFTSQIGLSARQVVVIGRGEAGAVTSAETVRDELWEADPRPLPGETLPETDGVFSHRWFDLRSQDWPQFRRLSVEAWDNFEDAHATRVIGFWRAREAPAEGLVRVWLMAWYESLAAWEGSRFYLDADNPRAAQAYANFRARQEITVDTGVSLLRRAT